MLPPLRRTHPLAPPLTPAMPSSMPLHTSPPSAGSCPRREHKERGEDAEIASRRGNSILELEFAG